MHPDTHLTTRNRLRSSSTGATHRNPHLPPSLIPVPYHHPLHYRQRWLTFHAHLHSTLQSTVRGRPRHVVDAWTTITPTGPSTASASYLQLLRQQRERYYRHYWSRSASATVRQTLGNATSRPAPIVRESEPESPSASSTPESPQPRPSSVITITHSETTPTTIEPESDSEPVASSTHPNFRSKTVCTLNCKYCEQLLCRRGMRAILLADTRVRHAERSSCWTDWMVTSIYLYQTG